MRLQSRRAIKPSTDTVWTVDAVRALGVRTDLVTAGDVLGIKRTKAYELANLGQFPVPVMRLGSKYVVPVAPLLELLAIGADRQPQDAA